MIFLFNISILLFIYFIKFNQLMLIKIINLIIILVHFGIAEFVMPMLKMKN